MFLGVIGNFACGHTDQKLVRLCLGNFYIIFRLPSENALDYAVHSKILINIENI